MPHVRGRSPKGPVGSWACPKGSLPDPEPRVSPGSASRHTAAVAKPDVASTSASSRTWSASPSGGPPPMVHAPRTESRHRLATLTRPSSSRPNTGDKLRGSVACAGFVCFIPLLDRVVLYSGSSFRPCRLRRLLHQIHAPPYNMSPMAPMGAHLRPASASQKKNAPVAKKSKPRTRPLRLSTSLADRLVPSAAI